MTNVTGQRGQAWLYRWPESELPNNPMTVRLPVRNSASQKDTQTHQCQWSMSARCVSFCCQHQQAGWEHRDGSKLPHLFFTSVQNTELHGPRVKKHTPYDGLLFHIKYSEVVSHENTVGVYSFGDLHVNTAASGKTVSKDAMSLVQFGPRLSILIFIKLMNHTAAVTVTCMSRLLLQQYLQD